MPLFWVITNNLYLEQMKEFLLGFGQQKFSFFFFAFQPPYNSLILEPFVTLARCSMDPVELDFCRIGPALVRPVVFLSDFLAVCWGLLSCSGLLWGCAVLASVFRQGVQV